MRRDIVVKYMQVLAIAFFIISLDMLKRHNKICDVGGLTKLEFSSLTGIKTTHNFLNHVIGKNASKTITDNIMNDQNIQPDLLEMEFFLNYFLLFLFSLTNCSVLLTHCSLPELLK